MRVRCNGSRKQVYQLRLVILEFRDAPEDDDDDFDEDAEDNANIDADVVLFNADDDAMTETLRVSSVFFRSWTLIVAFNGPC